MRAVRTLVLAAALAAATATASFNFVSLGDWGCMGVGGWRAQEEANVAKAFQQATSQLQPKFILNPGDNFYYCGVHTKTDDQWQITYENVFTDPSTFVPWWSALGNHDYGYPGSATAQMEYVSPNNNRWRMPNRYYYERMTYPEVNISLVVLDASPCQKAYISSDPSGYDPCGSVIPGCPGCTFHENVVAQSCSKQLAWLKQTLTQVPDGDWKIAMIHAPASDINVEDLITPLQTANFDLVVNGHVHLLAHYTTDNMGTYITSGAGCMVHLDNRAKSLKQQKDVDGSWHASSCVSGNPFHSCQIVFEDSVPGFTTHTFSEDFQTLTTQIIDYNGNVLHTTATKKGSGHVTQSPVPTTTGAPGPSYVPGPTHDASSCCFFHYKEGTCTPGQTCCDDEHRSYHEYACTHWEGKKHNCAWNATSSTCTVGSQ